MLAQHTEHVVVIRSAYDSTVPLETNQYRLRLTEVICVSSLAAQTSKNFIVEVRLHKDDPLFRQRYALFLSIGVHVSTTRTNRRIQTRMDDDDAIARDFIERVQNCCRSSSAEWFSFPNGATVDNGKWGPRQQIDNQFVTRVSDQSIYAVNHKHVTGHNIIDDRPAWLWVRHKHAKSPTRTKTTRPLTELTQWFGISPANLKDLTTP